MARPSARAGLLLALLVLLAGAVAGQAEVAAAPEEAPAAAAEAAEPPSADPTGNAAAAAALASTDFVELFLKNHPTPAPGGKPYNVCIADSALPYSYCLEANAEGVAESASAVIGFEAASVKKLLSDGFLAEWTYGQDWQFLCMGSREDIRADLTSSSPHCMAAAMGQDVNEESLKQGLRFSYFPSDRAGVVVLTTASVDLGGIWFFLKPFHWSVWVTWIVLTVVMIFVVYFCEISTAQDSNRYTKGWKGVVESTFNTTWFSFNRKGATLGEVSSTPARLLSIFWVFFLMIFLQIYTAQLAGLLAAKNIQGSVTSVEDLKSGSYDVAFPSDIAAAVSAAGVDGTQIEDWTSLDTPTAYFWLMDNAQSEGGTPMPEGIEELLDGPVGWQAPDALLLKSSEAALAESEYCNLFVVGKPFQTTTQALAFPANTSEATLIAFSVAQAKMQATTAFYDDSKISALINTFKTKNFEAAQCPGKTAASKTSQVKFKQIVGLLIVLSIGVGLAAVLVLWAFRKPENRAWHKEHLRSMRPRWTRRGGSCGAGKKSGAAAAAELGLGAGSKSGSADGATDQSSLAAADVAGKV